MIKSFWPWFWKGAGETKSGLRLLLNRRIFIHMVVAAFMNCFIKAGPFDFAAKALFPAASILVSMAVAWTSRAAAILQDKGFKDLIITNDNPLESYIYGYQLALLTIIIMVIYVAIMASGGLVFVVISPGFSIALSGFWLYFLLSFSVGQCWNVINFSNMLTLLNEHIRK